MTNKTTEQDMEAESVDTNDAAKTKVPEISEEIAAQIANEFHDDHDIQDAADTRKSAEDTNPKLSGSLSTDDTQHTISEISKTSENTHTDFTEAVEEVALEESEPEPEPIPEEPDYSIIAPGSLSRALKKCRDEADITVEDAAQEMRLPLAVVKALEAENFADLPDPPYVRGYLRSYARLNESDATNLINHYETLRGADPKDIASFTPVTPRYQPNNKKAVSPTTIKLAGFSMIVMLLVVLSMIPAVSQWASDTWQSFSEPQNQRLAATGSQNTATGTDDVATGTGEAAQPTQNGSSTASSNSDTATPDNTEQLALNQDAAGTNNTEETAGQNTTDGQAAETETPAGDTEQAADEIGATATANETQQDGTTDSDADKADPTATAAAEDSAEASATKAAEEAAAAEKREAALAAEAEAAKQLQEQAAAAEKAAAEKAEADKLAAQQAEGTPSDENFKQPIDGSVIIRMVFTQDVWMSIKDGRGKTIFGALNAAGTRKEIKATTPLQFKVGNAPGVQIYLNGQLIDQKPYTRGSVSTFRAN